MNAILQARFDLNLRQLGPVALPRPRSSHAYFPSFFTRNGSLLSTTQVPHPRINARSPHGWIIRGNAIDPSHSHRLPPAVSALTKKPSPFQSSTGHSGRAGGRGQRMLVACLGAREFFPLAVPDAFTEEPKSEYDVPAPACRAEEVGEEGVPSNASSASCTQRCGNARSSHNSCSQPCLLQEPLAVMARRRESKKKLSNGARPPRPPVCLLTVVEHRDSAWSCDNATYRGCRSGYGMVEHDHCR